MIHIRWELRRDLPSLLEIERQSFGFPWGKSEFVAALRTLWVTGLVAEIDSQVVGFVIYSLERGDEIDVLNLAVHPDHRRKGVGRELIRKLQGKLSHMQRNRITLVIRETNLQGQVFFRSCGFQAIATLKNQFANCDEDAYFMEYQERRRKNEAEVNRVKGKVI